MPATICSFPHVTYSKNAFVLLLCSRIQCVCVCVYVCMYIYIYVCICMSYRYNPLPDRGV